MKNILKTGLAALSLVCMLSACKGGVSGDKQDSTMVDSQAIDSTATKNTQAGTMSADTNGSPKRDSSNANKVITDTTKK